MQGRDSVLSSVFSFVRRDNIRKRDNILRYSTITIQFVLERRRNLTPLPSVHPTANSFSRLRCSVITRESDIPRGVACGNKRSPSVHSKHIVYVQIKVTREGEWLSGNISWQIYSWRRCQRASNIPRVSLFCTVREQRRLHTSIRVHTRARARARACAHVLAWFARHTFLPPACTWEKYSCADKREWPRIRVTRDCRLSMAPPRHNYN